MSEKESLSSKVEAINALLRSFGRQAVQEIKMVRDGKIIGQVRYGYRPQYVFDAVNSIIGPENWRYELINREIFEFQAVVEVKLFLRLDNEWLCKGAQVGQMQIVKKNVGDAYKGAITDALQKCFSLLSVGSDAYRGLLKEVYFSGARQGEAAQTSRQPDRTPPQSPADQPINNGLPKIDGIKYQRRNGIIVAVGNSFDKKELLKSAGFRWSGAEKHWYKEASTIQ